MAPRNKRFKKTVGMTLTQEDICTAEASAAESSPDWSRRMEHSERKVSGRRSDSYIR